MEIILSTSSFFVPIKVTKRYLLKKDTYTIAKRQLLQLPLGPGLEGHALLASDPAGKAEIEGERTALPASQVRGGRCRP